MNESNDHGVREAWKRVEAWLAREHPSGSQILAPGASVVQVQQLAADFGKVLPEDLQSLFVVHNGNDPSFELDWFVHSCAYDCGGGRFKLLSIDEAIAEWRLRNDSLKISDEENASLAGAAAGVKPVYWNRTGWLPLALGDDADCFFVDLDPADGGTVGQVFAWYKADGAARVVASSVGAWLSLLADGMDQERCTWTRRGFTMRTSKISCHVRVRCVPCEAFG